MLEFIVRTNNSPSQIQIIKLQKKTKFYWSLIRLLVAFWCFKLHSQHDMVKAAIFFLCILLEFMTSKLQSRMQAHFAIALIYVVKLYIGSQIRQNTLWLVPFSLFLQINLYMHGVPVLMLLGSTVTSIWFISSIESTFYSTDFYIESDILKMMFSSLFKGYQILSFNLMVGLIIMNYLYTNAFKKFANTKTKLKEVQEKFSDTAEKYKQMINTLDENNRNLYYSRKQLEQTQVELENTAKELNELNEMDEVLANGISHKVVEPFDTLLDKIQNLSNEISNNKSKEMLERSKFLGENILSSINNLIDIVKLKSGNIELNQTPKEVKELLGNFWKLASPKINSKGLQGALYISHHIPSKLVLDNNRVFQILRNVLDNAINFTQKGSIKVFVTWVQTSQDHIPSPSSPKLNLESFASDMPFQEIPFINENNPNQGFTMFRVYSSDGIRKTKVVNHEVEGLMDLESEDSSVQPLPDFKSNFISNMENSNYKKFGLHQFNFDEHFSQQQKKNFRKGTQGFLKIDLDDTGPGISMELQRKLFKPLTQEDLTEIEAETKRGFGLGLYITKRLLDKMGGVITYISKENSGTRFCIKIPCTVAQDENTFEIDVFGDRSPNISHPIINESFTKRALVMDDNPYILTLMENFLKEMGIEAETASDGLQGLEMFKSKKPGYYSLILTDIHMPIMDGIVASKAIRRLERERRLDKSIPIIVVTSTASRQEEKECLNLQGEIRASFLFRVPVSFSEFQIRVKSLIRENSDASFQDFQ